jgi:dipeptidase E
MTRTILLTSTGGKSVKETFLKILPKDPHNIHLAHIITASNEKPIHPWRDADKQAMERMGIQVTDIDIKGKTKQEVEQALTDKDVIYVQGGDTYYLLKYVKESGFDDVVKELVNKGIVYVGVSAGSYIACPTIEQSSWKEKKENIYGLQINESALGLVPFLVVVHYTDAVKEEIKNGIAHTTYPVRILTDMQGLLIQGDDVTFIGTGEEIRL